MRSAIVVVGSVNEDLHLRIDRLPRPGETILAGELRRSPGGKGANQAVAVARHDGHCVLIGAVGTDEAGRSLVATLRQAGVDTTHLRNVVGPSTGTAVVMVDRGGQNSIVVASGANMALRPADVIASLNEVNCIGTVLTQGELSLECIRATGRYAETHRARFILNLAPYRAVKPEILELCDPLIVNELEAESLVGQLDLEAGDPKEMGARLANYCRSVIVTWGARGAVYADGRRVELVPAPTVKVVDSTGAGDAFVGAATAALAHGADLAAGCRAGVEAGTLAVQHHGAQF